MDKALLDTDMLSEVLKGVDPKVAARAAGYRSSFGRFTISTVSVMEVVKGLRKLGDENRIQQFLSAVSAEELLTLDLASADVAGRMYADLESAGQTIGRADPLIAGIALGHGLTLVTGNTGHYQRIQALGYPLQLDNWRV